MIDQIKIAIADDHQLVTQSLSDFLKNNLPCEILFCVTNGQDLVDRLLKTEVDIILLDINMPGMDGLEALRIIKSRNSAQKIVVLTMFTNESLLLKLIKLKVNGYLSKSGSGEELLTAIKEVNEHGHFFSDRLLEVMYNKTAKITGGARDLLSINELDDIDMDILKMVCQELTSKEIASKLSLSPRTVEGRRKKLLKSIGAKNQAGMVMYAIRQGIVEI